MLHCCKENVSDANILHIFWFDESVKLSIFNFRVNEHEEPYEVYDDADGNGENIQDDIGSEDDDDDDDSVRLSWTLFVTMSVGLSVRP